MLKNAWYLITHVDFFDRVPDAPRLAQAPELMATLDELFGDEAGISPAHTIAAVEVMLRMAEHLSTAIPYGRRVAVADRDQFARLLGGLNLLLAYTAQLTGRLAHQVDTATGADLSALPTVDRVTVTTALGAASRRLEGDRRAGQRGAPRHHRPRHPPGAEQVNTATRTAALPPRDLTGTPAQVLARTPGVPGQAANTSPPYRVSPDVAPATGR